MAEDDPFDRTHRPQVGAPEPLAEGLVAVTAPNAGPMTFTGTRTYLLGRDEVAVIDPGPDDPDHLDAVAAALARGARATAILVTHAHHDHSEGARALADRLGAPLADLLFKVFAALNVAVSMPDASDFAHREAGELVRVDDPFDHHAQIDLLDRRKTGDRMGVCGETGHRASRRRGRWTGHAAGRHLGENRVGLGRLVGHGVTKGSLSGAFRASDRAL